MKNILLKTTLLGIILLSFFASCTFELNEPADAFVSVDEDYLTTYSEYDNFGNQLNYHEVNYTLFNSGDLTATDIEVLITMVTYEGYVIEKSEYINSLPSGSTFTSYVPLDLVNDQVKNFGIEVFWDD